MGSNKNSAVAGAASDREKIALDINLLKQQYGKLRQRQKQAQIILTAACARQTSHLTTASTSSSSSSSSSSMTLNNLLAGRSAITSNKGRRPGPPLGAIPPARNVSGTKSIPPKSTAAKPPKLPPETLHWKDTESASRRNSVKWKDIPRDEKVGVSTSEIADQEEVSGAENARSKFSARNRSESSSYSEDSDSSSDTSLCDDENVSVVKDSGSSIESSPFKKTNPELEVPLAAKIIDIKNCIESLDKEFEDVGKLHDQPSTSELQLEKEDLPITSTSQLSPVADFSHYLNVSSISPLKTPSSPFDLSEMLTTLSPSPDNHDATSSEGLVDDAGVTNTYFERINSVESDDTKTFEQNSSLSIPTYDIIDVDEMEQDTQLGRSTSLGVLRHSPVGTRLKSTISGTSSTETPSESKGVREKSFKGKSSSLEDTNRPVLRKSLPVSCSETIEVRRSEKALEIILENSKILHRILNKNNGSGAFDRDDDVEPVIQSLKSIEDSPTPSSVSLISDQGVVEDPPPESSSATKSFSETLSSIDDTIKSINSLCQERFIADRKEAVKKDIHLYNESPHCASHADDQFADKSELPNEPDKSPTSPVITRFYLESLKPSLNDTSTDRVIKSAESTPSRSQSRGLGYNKEADCDFHHNSTADLLDKYLSRNKEYLLKDCSPLPGTSMGLAFEYGIEPQKHKSLEFDAI